MTNSTLRQRLGIKTSNYPMASRIIRDTLDAKLVKTYASGSDFEKRRKLCAILGLRFPCSAM